MVYLFSYGTLQLRQVQLDSFGRELTGFKDQLDGYFLDQLEIHDLDVLKSSGQQFHPIARRSENAMDFIEGMVFEISDEELQQADAYEVDAYERVEVALASGKVAWVYASIVQTHPSS